MPGSRHIVSGWAALARPALFPSHDGDMRRTHPWQERSSLPHFWWIMQHLTFFLGGRGRHWISSKQTSKKRYLERWGLLADRYGLPIRDYWQTVQKICLGTDALLQSFEQCSNSCSFVQSFRGLPTRRKRQNNYIFCEQSANNLLLADCNGLPITSYWQTITACQ